MEQSVQNMFDLSNGQGFALPEPYYQQESEYSYQLPEVDEPFDDDKDLREKTEAKTTDISHFVTIDPPPKSLPYAIPSHPINSHKHSCLRTQIKNLKKGSKDDTMLLNTNFKTILMSYFHEKMFLRELSADDIAHIEEFEKRPPSFNSLSIFCKIQRHDSGIPEELMKLVHSSRILRKILERKCAFETKQQMIKFVQVFRRNLTGKGAILKWKTYAKQ